MYGDKTFNETKERLAEQGYSENGANTFVNKYGEKVETDGRWARKEGHGSWRNTEDEDNRF